MSSPEFAISLPLVGPVSAAARSAEDLGFDYVSCGEHVFFHGPTTNPFVTLSAAAGATSRIGLLSAVALAPLYPAVLFAKLVAALQVVSGERLTLGLGVGGENPSEFEALGVPRGERGARLEEALRVLRLLLSREEASYEGRFVRFSDVSLAPRPESCPPIWLAGRSDTARRRAARSADGWMPYLYSPEKLADQARILREELQALGREPAAVRVGVHLFAMVSDDALHARRRIVESVGRTYAQDVEAFADRYLLHGTPERVVARLAEYRDAGASLIVLRLTGEEAEREEQTHRLAEVAASLRGA